MPFSGKVDDGSPKKLKQSLLSAPLGGESSKEQKGKPSSSAQSFSRSEYRTNQKRNRLRLHDRKSVENHNGWAEVGGYMNAKRQKHLDQFKLNINREILNAGQSTNIFQGVSIYVDGYTKPSSDELRRLMMLHGGHYEVYLSKEKVTHIIATNLPDSKIISLRNYKVVHPDWILKSIESGRLLSYASFQLFTSQSKFQKSIVQFSATNKNSDSLRNIHTLETNSSLTFQTERKNLQTLNPISPQSSEIDTSENTTDDLLESPRSCHSEDLFLSSFEESSQESKTSKKSQETNAATDSPKCDVSLSPKQFNYLNSKNKAPYSNFHPIAEKSLLQDNEDVWSFPSEVKLKEPLSTLNVCEKSSLFDNCSANQHQALPLEMTNEKSTQEKKVKATNDTNKTTMKNLTMNQKPNLSTSFSSNPVSFTQITSDVPKKTSHSTNAKTAREADYLNQFYNNSRLHHLSTWKVEWKNYVSAIKARLGNNFPGREKLKSITAVTDSKQNTSSIQRYIMHIDMDSFFVSVALRDRPELKDKPVGVTHSQKKGPSSDRPGVDIDYERQQWIKRRKERALKGKTAPDGNSIQMSFDDEDEEENQGDKNSPLNYNSHATDEELKTDSTFNTKSEASVYQSFSEIASCNYVARKAGLKNGMLVGDALKLCPNLITLPYEFEKYQEVSKILYDTVTSYTHDIEAVSCDEMLVDCTGLLQETGVEVDEFVSILRQEIFEKTRCTASAGLGPNILVARLATHKAKPNGQFLVRNKQINDFIKDQTLKNLPGVGRSMMYKLEHLHAKTCGDLQRHSLSTLKQEFGPKTGQLLFDYCRGKDDRCLQVEYDQKSVSAEINYGIRFKDDNDMDEFLKNLSSEVESRLKKANKQGKTITLKLMVRRPDAPLETAKYMGHGLCNNICKSMTLAMATNQATVISKKCMSMYKALKLTASDLRGIGISIHRLENLQNLRTSGNFNSGRPNILKFAKTLPLKAVESNKSPTSPTLSFSLTQEDSSGYMEDMKNQDSDFCPMKPVHVKQFGSINFMEELSRQKTSSEKLPPLPRLPSQKTLDELPALKLPAPKLKCEDFLPSPSQVDNDVLNELPADIRHQIQLALKQKQINKNKNETTTTTPLKATNLDQPGCSHWKAPNSSDFVDEKMDVRVKESVSSTVHNMSDIESELLPNLSQVDENCLNELPEDIQQEMRAAMKQREIRKKDEALALSTAKCLSPMKMMCLLSPTKDSSPTRARGAGSKRKSPHKTKKSPGKKRSPHFKVPRGRPRARRGFGSRTVLDARKKLFLYGNIDDKYSEKNSEVNPSSQSSNGSSQPPMIVSLGDAVTITEVRHLLREWLTTFPEPTVDDELFLIDYLKALVIDKNLEQVDLVLKFLYRNICRLKAENWFASLQNIVDQVQKAVMSQYKSKLKLGFSLPIT